MQFLIPWMLAGTLAAGVPLALHFLRKSKPVVVPWAAMAFLRRSLRETSRKIRFRDLLLLICRMALFILLAIAIARPTLSSLPLSGATDAVLVMDVSQSMATQEAGVSRLEQATDALIIINAHKHTTVFGCRRLVSVLPQPQHPSSDRILFDLK